MCVTRMPAGAARTAALEREIDRARRMAVDEDEPMLADNCSALYEVIVDALKEDGRDADAKSTATQWATFLEGEAERAPDPAARAVFDAHRLDAYLAIGAPDCAVPMLEATARDFPGDYNPPARLARAYLGMKRYGEALSAIDRALGLVYGPRALRLYATKADILEARAEEGDRARAAATLKDGLARAGTGLPPRYAPLAGELMKRQRALEGRAKLNLFEKERHPAVRAKGGNVMSSDSTSATVLQLGDPRLRAIATPILDVHEATFVREVRTLTSTLLDFRESRGFGRAISAPQIGLSKRFVVIELGDGPIVLANPEITWRSDASFAMWDDCMSFPSLLVRVHRHE